MIQIYQYLGVRGPFFSAGFFIKEAVESALQTTQAYRSSQHLSSSVVNLSYATLIFLNYFACGIIDIVFRSHPTTQRLVSVLVDLILDFAWGTVIPCVILWPYFQIYLSRGNGGTVEGDLAQQELQYLLVMSKSSFLLSVFPFVSSLGNIRGMKRLLSVGMLTDTLGSTSEASNNRMSIHDPPARLCATRARQPVLVWLARVYPKDTPLQRVPATRRACSLHLAVQIGQMLLLLYGVCVVGVAIKAVYSSSELPPVGCANRVYPWLSSGFVCSKVSVNCTQTNIAGRSYEMEASLHQINSEMLTSLEILDCPELEVPPAIRQLSKLTVITIRNSNLLSWSMDAALTADALPNMLTVRLDSVQFTSVPDGLIGVPLPPWLEWISIYDVNADMFIDHIGENWSKLKYFYCDLCGLTSVPRVVETMTGLLELSFCYNDITDLGGNWLDTAAENLENLWVDECAVSSFPTELWQLTEQLHEFSIQGTNISSIPKFVDGIADEMLQIDGFGTPLCANPDMSTVEYLNYKRMIN